MSLTTRDTTGKKRFAFRDIRTAEELLKSGRPPKSVSVKRSASGTTKLAKLSNKIGGGLLRAGLSALKTKAAPLAAKAALGPIGGAIAAQVAGKYGGPLLDKLAGKVASFAKLNTATTTGINITEEMNPDNIRRPLPKYDNKISSSASVIAAPLSQTVASAITSTLTAGTPQATGMPNIPRIFKTPASLVKSPRFFNPYRRTFTVKPDEKILADKAVRHVVISTPEARLYPQAGLLEDELMHRLVLLAENVYAPAREYAVAQGWGTPTILDGFRAENSTTSPHERGEAIDITIKNDATKCFNLAVWLRDHILYDQLILCFDITGQTWLHISFNATARRRQVLTKTFNDTFVEGLHIYQAGSPADVAADVIAGDNYLKLVAQREQRLYPVAIDSDLPQQSSDLLNALSGDGAGRDCGTPASIPDEFGTVLEVYKRGGWNLVTDEGGGLFVDAVVKQLGGPWGHIRKSGGQTQAFGHAVDAIMYKSGKELAPGKYGQVVDIISSHGSSAAAPAWQPVCSPVVGDDWFQ